jgi:hypothetical protein
VQQAPETAVRFCVVSSSHNGALSEV